jgi:type 1 glutamine amidotransferase
MSRMPDRRALIVWGGWDGHQPEQVADLFKDMLEAESFQVQVASSLDAFADAESMRDLSLIVPIVTMSTIAPEQRDPVLRAVAQDGVGLAGCHGGMCDAFRNDTEWQFMTGSQWVAHPGNDGVKYQIKINRDLPHPITEGMEDFPVASEQYYLHVDPAVQVLAYTEFPTPGVEGPHTGNPCLMPQVYTKMYGQGRVYYNALGHQRDVLEAKQPKELMRRGFLWAAKK